MPLFSQQVSSALLISKAHNENGMSSHEIPDVKGAEKMPGCSNTDISNGLADQVLLIVARLMEAGQEDEDTCRTLDSLTKILSEEPAIALPRQQTSVPLHELIDADSFDTILGFLDMRESAPVRGHATLTVSAFLKASEQKGTEYLSEFFKSRVSKGTYDDFIVAFSVASCIFPIVPSISAVLFLSDGFVNGLGSLMKRKWKSKKVEQACLEMLNAACMDSACREAIQKHCMEWLEEIVLEQPKQDDGSKGESDTSGNDVSHQQRVHSENVRNLAAVILAKLQSVPSTPSDALEERIKPVSTSLEDLTDMFTSVLAIEKVADVPNAIEGLAYTSIQPKVKERLVSDPSFLSSLIRALSNNPARSPSTYGALSVLVNLTSYLPTLSDEQKRMIQLKTYASASKSSHKPDPLNDDEHVAKRCKAVFEAGVIPVLVIHCQHGSVISLNLVVTIVFSLSKDAKMRGKMAQQGAVKLLLHAYSVFPITEVQARHTTAHALARILISTNPAHVFGGSNPLSLTSSIRPLLSLLADDLTVEQRDLLPVFESLLALTNIASIDDTARNPIIRLSWPAISELLISNNEVVTRATVELICNLMQSPEGVAKFADGSKQASHMMHILLALSDAEDFATRRAAGGALASLTEWDTAVNAILERDRGVGLLLGLCKEDDDELRHRGVVCVLNLVSAPEKVGEWGLKKMREEGAVEVLKECLKKSRNQQVLETTVEALKKLLDTP